jgi:cytochrome c oxidase subunit 2
MSVFDPASPPAAAIRDLFWLVLAITGAIFVLVQGMLIYCVIRFRQKDTDSTLEPPQIYGSTPIEVAWTVAPTLVVFVLFLVVCRGIADVRHGQIPEGAFRVVVVGHQWWWEYQYPDHGFVTANELHVPVGRPIHLELRSADVVHSYWVPRLAGKTDVIPNRVNRMWFQADQPELFFGQCAEYCGDQHGNMLIRVYAQTEADFQRWVEGQKKVAVDDPSVREGRDLFLTEACMNCHRVRGTAARGTFGPDLTHLMSRETLGSCMIRNDPEKLRLWVKDPQPIKPGCLMPDMKLDDRQLDLVVKYLETLR